MSGVNPYIQKGPGVKATTPFKVTFVDEATGTATEVAVDPATFPLGHIGLEGSVLDIAAGAGVEINHSCGGVCACSTCHVHVQTSRSWLPSGTHWQASRESMDTSGALSNSSSSSSVARGQLPPPVWTWT